MQTIYKPLGRAITKELNRNDFTPTFLSPHLASVMGFDSGSKNLSSGFAEYLRNVTGGYVYGKPNFPRDSEHGLERLSILMDALNFSERYPNIIDKIKEIDERLEYPPLEDKRVSYDQLKAAYEAMKNGQESPAKGIEAIV
ncbi:MAG: hypothetical protein IIC69_00680 [Nanoarchaeota archaeon]|nr:hypothetical protein [Nanoarchaeota archaeon]